MTSGRNAVTPASRKIHSYSAVTAEPQAMIGHRRERFFRFEPSHATQSLIAASKLMTNKTESYPTAEGSRSSMDRHSRITTDDIAKCRCSSGAQYGRRSKTAIRDAGEF